jgi:hypothetical protein
LENLKEKKHFGDLRVDTRIILKRFLRKWDVTVWTGFNWLGVASYGSLL